MSIMTSKDRAKLKLLLGRCLVNGKLEDNKVDIFLEVAVRLGYDICEENVEMAKQDHEAKVEARKVKWDDEL
jgi:hypothetical protein